MTSVIAEVTMVPGTEELRALLERTGVVEFLGMDVETLEPGRVVFELKTRPEFGNPMGGLHGGISCTLLDSAMSCAVHTALPEGASYTTLEVKVNFVRPVRLDGTVLRCEGTTVHVGGRVATAEGRITDEEGRLVGHGTTTCMVFKAA